MRWFKHLTQSRNDENLVKLIEAGGLKYYALWWITLEIIAGHMDKTDRCSAEYPAKKWASLACTSSVGWAYFTRTAGELGLLNIEVHEGNMKVGCPNLLKYKDEYSKKSGQTPDKLRTNSGQTPDQDTETDTEDRDNKKQKQILSYDDEIALYFSTIPDSDIAEWMEAYPAVDIEGELRRAKQWLISNPAKKKKQFRRFITNWFGRCQEKGGSRDGEKKRTGASGQGDYPEPTVIGKV